MSYKDILTSIKLHKMTDEIVTVHDLLCQHNPDRYNIWKKYAYKTFYFGSPYDTLHVLNSPHYDFMLKILKIGYVKFAMDSWKLTTNTNYYKLQREYGRDHAGAINKMENFYQLFHSMRVEGMKEQPMVLNDPIVPVKDEQKLHNYEIYEGHHRIVVAIILGLPLKVGVYGVKRPT